MLTDIQRRSIETLHAMVTDAYNRTRTAWLESLEVVGEQRPELPQMLVDAMISLDRVTTVLARDL